MNGATVRRVLAWVFLGVVPIAAVALMFSIAHSSRTISVEPVSPARLRPH